jgi:glycosyltransferase involved in cell wall biosynthesis
MKGPLVSVVVPVYNGERFLAAALDSIFAQDYRPLEVIVVDDGSVDGTAEIAKSYQEVRYIYQANQGHGKAKNAGLAAASGEFIAFLDADDLWAPHKLSAQIGYLLDHPDIPYVSAKMRNFIEPGTRPPKRKDLLVTESATMIVGALTARKSAFKVVGDFDPSYRVANDTDWFFRAKQAGMPLTVLPEVLLYRRLHDSNQSYETGPMASEFLRAVKSSIERLRKLRPAEVPSRKRRS